MPDLAVIGAGHAGVEAAAALAKAGHRVTLWSDEPELPYFRPRLIAVAFGQAEPDAIRIKPETFYAQTGIALRHERAERLDLASRTVNGEVYDGIVLAQGSRPFVPPFAGDRARLHTLWDMADARRLREAVRPGVRLAVIGGGVLGLEAALRAAMAGLKVSVVEAAPRLVNGVLGDGAEGVLRAALETKGITLSVGKGIAEIAAEGLRLDSGNTIETDLILCSTGARPNVALGEAAGLPADCGLRTGADLAAAPRVYVAGDLARPTERRPVCAVRRATAMGALAAANLCAELSGAPTTPWSDPVLPLFMKVGDVEFHTLGLLGGEGLDERRVDDGANPAVWQSVLCRGDQPVGLRWVGTRAGFGDWEKRLAR